MSFGLYNEAKSVNPDDCRFPRAAIDPRHMLGHLGGLKSHGIAFAIVDPPPGTGDSVRDAVTCADMVIIPCRPSPHDLRAVGSTLDIVESADKPFAFVINAAVPRSTIAQEALRALAQHGKVAPVTLHHRIDFAASMVDGAQQGSLAARLNRLMK